MMKSVPLNRNSKLTSFLRQALKSETRAIAGAQCLARGRKWVGAAAVIGSLLASLSPVHAVDYVWRDFGNDWDNNADWLPAGFPSAATDTAFFGPDINNAVAPISNINNTNIIVGTVTFGAGAQAYNINQIGTGFLTLVDAVVNNSGNTQSFNRVSAANLNISAVMGSNIVVNNNNATGRVQFFTGGNAGGTTLNNNVANSLIQFIDNSTAGAAKINNIGDGSFTSFQGSSNAGTAVISNLGDFATTEFTAFSSGGLATVINGATGILDISGLDASVKGTTVGSIEGGGFVVLGDKNLEVGGNNKNTIYAGEISGDGGSLTKVGAGRLTLTGINIYTGDTRVKAGGLYINGSIISPNTFVDHGGLLGGTGTIGGNVFNHGVVKPGNSPGTLHVKGNYTQYSDGDLRIEIGSRDNYGRLQVAGTANLDGSVTAVAVNGYKPKKGDKYTVLTAGGGVNGEFDEVKTNFPTHTILNLEATYKSNSVILEFKRGSFLDFAKTYNQRAVARALDKVSHDGKEGRLLNHLDNTYVENLPNDFDRIAPEELAAATEVSMSYANVTNGNISRHNDELRTGNGGYLASSLSAQGSSIAYSGAIKFRTGAAGPTGDGKESKESKEVFEPENRWGAFLTGTGEWVDVSGDGNARGYDINSGGFTLGIDYKVTPNLAVGITAGYVGSKADLTDNGRVLVNGGKLGLYATYFTGGFYVDAAATGGYNSYDTRRKGLGGDVRGDTEGGEISALFGTGYDFKVGNWSFGPTANVQYTYVAIDDFRERGSLAPLHVQDQEQESFRTSIGFRTSYDIKLRGGGILIRPELKLAWQHEFADDAYSIDARFRQSGDVFSVDGPDMGRDSLLLGAGFVVLFSERVSTYLYYDAQLARTNYESHSISGGVRIAF